MKKTLALLGLLFIGLGLVLSPALGLLSDHASDASVLSIDAVTTTTVEPAPEDPSTATSETGQPEATTSTTQPTTTVAARTIVGPAVGTEYGPFQVQVTIEDGRLIDITTLEEPGDRRSLSINGRALPAYESAAIDAQSADIDVISGATITWQAYTESLQAALDQAGLT